MTTIVYTIYGFDGCGYFNAALEMLKTLASKNTRIKIYKLQVSREDWKKTLDNVHKNHKLTNDNLKKLKKHSTSPLIFKGNAYLGGHDNLKTHLKL